MPVYIAWQESLPQGQLVPFTQAVVLPALPTCLWDLGPLLRDLYYVTQEEPVWLSPANTNPGGEEERTVLLEWGPGMGLFNPQVE